MQHRGSKLTTALFLVALSRAKATPFLTITVAGAALAFLCAYWKACFPGPFDWNGRDGDAFKGFLVFAVPVAILWGRKKYRRWRARV